MPPKQAASSAESKAAAAEELIDRRMSFVFELHHRPPVGDWTWSGAVHHGTLRPLGETLARWAASADRTEPRVPNVDYAHPASHYRFDPRACMPARGQEKPDVESGVKALQKRACTPVPTAADLEDLNRQPHCFCVSERARRVSGQTQTIGERFDAECQQAIPLHTHPFDPCVSSAAVVDKYQTVRLGTNRYSVRREAVFRGVTVRAYTDRVVVLAALRVRPGALDHGGVFKDWQLPPVFEQLRQRLEKEHGPRGGVRHYVRVLQLLGRHPAARVTAAVTGLWHRVHLRAEDVEQKTEGMAAADTPTVKFTSSPARNPSAPAADRAAGTHVPPPDLGRFNRLLPSYQGDDDGHEDRSPARPAATAQPQGAAPADDAERVRQAVP